MSSFRSSSTQQIGNLDNSRGLVNTSTRPTTQKGRKKVANTDNKGQQMIKAAKSLINTSSDPQIVEVMRSVTTDASPDQLADEYRQLLIDTEQSAEQAA